MDENGTTGATPSAALGALRVAGVPEAFNLPFHHANFSQTLSREVRFISYPGGSGPMLQAVETGEVDVAFALTDCIVAGIEKGKPLRILGPVVKSPLTWAIIVSKDSSIQTTNELSKATWGISRYGSGSHVMVQVLVKESKWEHEPKFVECRNFDGLRSAVNDRKIDAFLWEYYTTRPFEEQGEVRIVGGIPTPWGCFSAVVRENCEVKDALREMLNMFLEAGAAFVKNPEAAKEISEEHKMSEGDAATWLKGLRYANMGETRIQTDTLEMTRKILLEAGVIEKIKFKDAVERYHIS